MLFSIITAMTVAFSDAAILPGPLVWKQNSARSFEQTSRFERPVEASETPTENSPIYHGFKPDLRGENALLQIKLVPDAPWVEVLRLDVGDTADRDIRPVGDARRFEGVMICAEKNTVRIRRAEVKLNNGRWQRLFVPLALEAGKCAKPVELLGGPRKIRGFQFDYEALSAGYGRGILVVKGQPEVQK